MQNPWTEIAARRGYTTQDQWGSWDAANWPFIVRWSVSYNGGDFATRNVHSMTHIREFKTMADAVAAYKKPFKGLSAEVLMYNGGKPGSHLTRLAFRKCGKPTKWEKEVPAELRG